DDRVGRKAPRAQGVRARRPRIRRRLDRSAGVDECVRCSHAQVLPGLRKGEIHLARPAAEHARRQAWQRVTGLFDDRNAVRNAVGERRAGSIAAGANDETWPLFADHAPDAAPRREQAGDGAPVVPYPRAIRRMQGEEHVRKAGPGQDVALDTAPGPDEVRLDVGPQSLHGSRDRQAGIQVSACPAAGEQDSHRRPAKGFVAPTPSTRSRVLPMFTRTPVTNMVSTRFDRPYDTNGSVRPVVGRRPMTTPMWR